MSRVLRLVAVALAAAVLVGSTCKNVAPESPTIYGPGVGKPGAALTFGFAGTDPNGDDIWYMVSWGDGTVPAWSVGHPSGEQHVENHTYADSGTYFIKAKVKDAGNAESGWSDSVQVAIGHFRPNTPFRPTGTAACTTGVAYTYTTRAIHPNEDSIAFQYNWGDTLGPYGPMVASGAYFQTTHVFETLGTYIVRARAKDARGLESGWSNSLEVTVGPSQGGSGGAPRDIMLGAATDSTVAVSWSPPASGTPNRYIVLFRQTGTTTFDSVGGTLTLSTVHDPAGGTGAYKVTAVFDSASYTSTDAPSTAPISTGSRAVSELSGDGSSGYGWSRTSGVGSLFDMRDTLSAASTDFYVSDYAPGTAGPDYSVYAPDRAPSDPGDSIPAADWKATRFYGPLADENDPLPSSFYYTYTSSALISPSPSLVSCHTEDGYYALVKTTAVDTLNGTADIQTWFQPVRFLRLIQH
jgi:hypothetical protein